jgi:hypothetical protein
VKRFGDERESESDAEVRGRLAGEPNPIGPGSPLLEREEELRRIAASIALAKGGSGGIVALEGSPGIGKTRLLQAATQLAAADDVAVVSARGGQLETDLAFGVARQLFEPASGSRSTSQAACRRAQRSPSVAAAHPPSRPAGTSSRPSSPRSTTRCASPKRKSSAPCSW